MILQRKLKASDPDHVFPDSNEANNVWTAAKGVIEKLYFRWVGTFSSKQIPLKITFLKKKTL
jgi:hypothetical protein